MRQYQPGQKFYNLIKTAIPDFVEAEYPAFVEFVTAFLHFLEQERETSNTSVTPGFGPSSVSTTVTDAVGGPLYEASKFFDYLDSATTLDEFRTHFLAKFAKEFPQYGYVSTDWFIRSLRAFYQHKGTPSSIKWFFRVFFNEDADVYFPRDDVFSASSATWSAPQTLKVELPNSSTYTPEDVVKYYTGARVVSTSETYGPAEAIVERVTTYVVGVEYGTRRVIHELALLYGSVSGQFKETAELRNIDGRSNNKIITTIIQPVIAQIIVGSGGTNYANGDLVVVSEGPGRGEGYGAYGVVERVSNGAISGITIHSGGKGFTVGEPLQFYSASGSGASGRVASLSNATSVIPLDVIIDTFADTDVGNANYEDDAGVNLGIVLSGTTSTTSGCTTVTGVGTKFTTELYVGETLLVGNSSANTVGTIASIQSNTSLTLSSGASGSFSANVYGLIVDQNTAVASIFSAAEQRPFYTPWIWTNDANTTAELANAAILVDNLSVAPFFNHNASSILGYTGKLFVINDLLDNATTVLTSTITSNTVGYFAGDLAGNLTHTSGATKLYLRNIPNLNKLKTSLVIKQDYANAQIGTVTTDGTDTVIGTNTLFQRTLIANAHLRVGNSSSGYDVVVKSIESNTVIKIYGTAPTRIANTYGTYALGRIRLIYPRAITSYGTINTIALTSIGNRYAVPPVVDVDSTDARVQTLFYYSDTADVIVPTSGRVTELFQSADLAVVQGVGQIARVRVRNTGVLYTNPDDITFTVERADGSTGADATLVPMIGAVTNYPGEFLTNKGFTSSTTRIQDANYYNDYTYVIKAAESFDRYRSILLKVLHPAGFRPYGKFVSTTTVAINVSSAVEATILIASSPSESPSSSLSPSTSASHSFSPSGSASATASPSSSKSASVSPSSSTSASASPSPTKSPSASQSPSSSMSPSSSQSPSSSASASVSPSRSFSPSSSRSPSSSVSSSISPSRSISPSSSESSSKSRSVSPSASVSPSRSVSPSSSTSASISPSASVSPSASKSRSISNSPSASVSPSSSVSVSASPSSSTSASVSPSASASASVSPSASESPSSSTSASDRKSTRLNSSHVSESRMPSSA